MPSKRFFGLAACLSLFAFSAHAFDDQPMPVPYLMNPPPVISIDKGRQLFVDDFLISTTTLKRVFHAPEDYEHNPVIVPDQSWEKTGQSPTATVYSDGVWFDPSDHLFKMWYMCGYTTAVCYATSSEGLLWKKPKLDVVKGTNIVLNHPRDSTTVWLDQNAKNKSERFKMLLATDAPTPLELRISADGIHWSEVVAHSGPTEDPRSTLFYNPFRGVWVCSVRTHVDWQGDKLRARLYTEDADVRSAVAWKHPPVWWIGPDRLDPVSPVYKAHPQLYNLDAFPYESLMVGLFSIWQGMQSGRPKINEVFLGFSRDGFHWDRSDRSRFLTVSENPQSWKWGNVQSAGGGCLIVGDKLYFYYSGRTNGEGRWTGGTNTVGVALLRRDGFASMEATSKEGILTTRPVTFEGRYLFVNMQVKGALSVEILNKDGTPLPLFSGQAAQSVKGDSTRTRIVWKNEADVASLIGTPVRFRFHMSDGRLYSFWVSRSKDGESDGYVAAGGPDFTGPADQPR